MDNNAIIPAGTHESRRPQALEGLGFFCVRKEGGRNNESLCVPR